MEKQMTKKGEKKKPLSASEYGTQLNEKTGRLTPTIYCLPKLLNNSVFCICQKYSFCLFSISLKPS